MKKTTPSPAAGAERDAPERIAKVIARAGLCSRRDAESWIAAGRVKLNGRLLDSPAVTVKAADTIEVDGQPLPKRERTRLWLFHKPKGTVATTHDPEGRPTIFTVLPQELPRVMTVGRLDINTEGLLLLTNDGGLARVLELPATGWLRRYRVRAHGDIDQARLDALKDGVAIDGILYGSVEASLDRKQGDNVWLTFGLREGKNREVKNILAHLGLEVNRLIRISFGPFQLGELAAGAVEEVPRRVLISQLGERLSAEAGADFELRPDDRQPVQRKLAAAARGEAGAAGRERNDPRVPEAKGTLARGGAPARPAKDRRPEPAKAKTAVAGKRRATLALAGGVDAPSERPGRLSRKAIAATDGAAPRAYRSGKAFEVDRKASERKSPATVRGADKPHLDDPMRERGRTAHPKGGRPGRQGGGRNADRRR